MSAEFGVFLPVASGGWIVSRNTPVLDGGWPQNLEAARIAATVSVTSRILCPPTKGTRTGACGINTATESGKFENRPLIRILSHSLNIHWLDALFNRKSHPLAAPVIKAKIAGTVAAWLA